jgi:hypothetical protein
VGPYVRLRAAAADAHVGAECNDLVLAGGLDARVCCAACNLYRETLTRKQQH